MQSSPKNSGNFHYRPTRSISRSASEKTDASNPNAPVPSQNLSSSVGRGRSNARMAAPSPVRSVSAKPTHQPLNVSGHTLQAKTNSPAPSVPRAERSKSSPPKSKTEKSVQFAEGTQGTSKQRSMSPPLVRTKSSTPKQNAKGHSRHNALTSPTKVKAARSVSISPRKTTQKLQAQLAAAKAQISDLQAESAKFFEIKEFQKIQVEVLNRENSRLMKENIRLSEKVHELTILGNFLVEEKQ